MRSLVHATAVLLLAQNWVACDKKKSDKGNEVPTVPSTVADQVGNTKTPDELTAVWSQLADRIKEQAQSINTKVSPALYMTLANEAQVDCLSPKATYSSVENPNINAVIPIYFRCDAKPSCQMLIAKFKDEEKRSWPKVKAEELYILAQFIKESELVSVTESCGSAETMATNISNYGISDLGYTFQNVSDDDFAALVNEKKAPTSQGSSPEFEDEETFILLPTFAPAVAVFGNRLESVFAKDSTSQAPTVLPAAECEAIFDEFQGLMLSMEQDTRKVANTVRDLKNLLTIDPNANLLEGDKNPYRDLFASSIGFESIENGVAIASGYIGMKGDAEKVVAQAFIKTTDNSIDPMIETLLADSVLNKIYFNSSAGWTSESNGKTTRYRGQHTLIFDYNKFSVESTQLTYADGSIVYDVSASVQMIDGKELVNIVQDNEGKKSTQRITKDTQSAQCLLSSK